MSPGSGSLSSDSSTARVPRASVTGILDRIERFEMTTQKHLKARVRARMEKTGERYAAARANVVGSGQAPGHATPAGPTIRGIRHFPGTHPETTALRVLLTHAGVRARVNEPLSEPLVLVIGGGIGAGVFSFNYEKEDVVSLFLAGRHRWDDSRAWVQGACERLGVATMVSETGSKARAERDLRTALEHGPAIAWVDLAILGTRALPTDWAGGAYHVVTVYEIDDATDEAVIGDLADEPVRLPLATLAAARARITSQRNRVVGLRPDATVPTDIADAIAAGLRATVEGLTSPRGRNFSLDAFRDLATRMHGARGKESWSRVFPRGPRLWEALRSVHEYVDHFGSGGGLLRPMFAAGLAEAAGLTGDDRLETLANRYRALGRRWHELAEAALPSEVPLLAETRQLQDRRDHLYREGGAAALRDLESTWRRLAELRDEAAAGFPLDEAATDALLADLKQRLLVIHREEVDALDELRAIA